MSHRLMTFQGKDGMWWCLSASASRFARVTEFKGHKLIDIREFYTDKATGELKPGAKGISLKPNEFEGERKDPLFLEKRSILTVFPEALLAFGKDILEK
jgi:hypothetical protein